MGNLFPDKELDITMIGDELSPTLQHKLMRHTNRHNESQIYFRVFVGHYKDHLGTTPDIVVGMTVTSQVVVV